MIKRIFRIKMSIKFWKRYCLFTMGLFTMGIIANLLNASFFLGHDNQAIQTIAYNFGGLTLVDASLLWLHLDFYFKKKHPRSGLQWALTLSNVLVVTLNIILTLRIYNIIDELWQAS